jgi:hypothetical protein
MSEDALHDAFTSRATSTKARNAGDACVRLG